MILKDHLRKEDGFKNKDDFKNEIDLKIMVTEKWRQPKKEAKSEDEDSHTVTVIVMSRNTVTVDKPLISRQESWW